MTSATSHPAYPASRTEGQLLSEGLIGLAEAAAEYSDSRGRKPHVATLRRWAKQGCRGHRLETAFLGNRLMTSRPAVARFLAALNGQPAPSPAETNAAAELAGRELRSLLG